MSLQKGSSAAARSANIAELIKAGHDPKQAEAIAYRVAGNDMQPSDWRGLIRGLFKWILEEEKEPEHAKDGAGDAAGVIFVAPDGDVLLLRRSEKEENYAGHWALPGGNAEPGETPERAADREVKEEIGETAAGEKSLFEKRQTPNGMTFHTFVQKVDSKFDPKLNGEHDKFMWATPKDPPAPIHPAVAENLKKLVTNMTDDNAKKPRASHDLKRGDAQAADSIAFDYSPPSAENRKYDMDGRLHVGKTNISKANVCEYYGREIPNGGSLGLDPDRKYRLLRDPVELKKAASTFNNLPLLDRHIPVSAADHHPEFVIGSTGTDAEFEHPYLKNSLVIWAKDAIEDVESEIKKELSSSYRYTADMTPGEHDGEPFDGVMRNIIGNHLCLCKEGRAGPDVVVGDSKENLNMPKSVLTRKAALVQGALTAFLAPLLAADAKLDVTPLVADIDIKNYPRRRPILSAAIAGLTKGKLAKDAKLDGLDPLLLALDAMEPEEPAAEDEESEEEKKARMEKEAKDKAKDRKARDEDLKERLKDKMSASDWKAACDEIDGMSSAEDEEDETDEEKKVRLAKEAKDKRARDAEPKDMVTKKDVDKAMDEAISGERQRQRDVREAERFVRPWIGDLVIAYDSADEVYKAALEARGKAVKGIHPSAYRSILEMMPKPGAENRRVAGEGRLAMDAAKSKGFADMYPDAMRVKLN
jgi:8-oxo-dGTP pyrophosphatase MutT (NUDIX family)